MIRVEYYRVIFCFLFFVFSLMKSIELVFLQMSNINMIYQTVRVDIGHPNEIVYQVLCGCCTFSSFLCYVLWRLVTVSCVCLRNPQFSFGRAEYQHNNLNSAWELCMFFPISLYDTLMFRPVSIYFMVQ